MNTQIAHHHHQQPALPMISVLMPTRGRRRFIPQALRCFLQQDYPNKELLIIDEGDEPVYSQVPQGDPHIRYIYLGWMLCRPEPLTIGMKRNIAASLAHGDIFVQQDDDDYFGPRRLSRQAAPIIAGKADVTAMQMTLLLHAPTGTLWRCSEEVHRALFAHNVRSGTLMYRASYWQGGLYYANRPSGEDVGYLSGLLSRGARLGRVVDPNSYICVRHSDNISGDLDGLGITGGWEQVPLARYLSPEDRAFYEQLQTPMKEKKEVSVL
jgi:glycosyltransferase involved in cell wall biosynthesis